VGRLPGRAVPAPQRRGRAAAGPPPRPDARPHPRSPVAARRRGGRAHHRRRSGALHPRRVGRLGRSRGVRARRCLGRGAISGIGGAPACARTRRRPVRSRSIGDSIPVRAGTRTCGDVWFRQGLATGEREPRTPLGLVNQVAKRSTWQPPVDSRPRCLGSKVSVEATSASRVVEASCSEAAIRTSVA
jgi:hypothetical protein